MDLPEVEGLRGHGLMPLVEVVRVIRACHLASRRANDYLLPMWYDTYVASVWLSYTAPALLALALLYEAAEQVKAKWDIPGRPLPALRWVCIRIILGAFVLLLVVRAGASYLSARELRADAVSLSGELISFAEERQARMPSTGAKDWDAYTRAVAQVCSATRNDYAQRYAPRVLLLRREFARRELTDSALDSFYAHPSDPLTVRTVGERLALLAQQLR